MTIALLYYSSFQRSNRNWKNQIFNLFFLWSMMYGNGMIISSYFYEYFVIQKTDISSVKYNYKLGRQYLWNICT